MHKKLMILTASLFTLFLSSQEDKSWRIGGQIGFHGNHSNFSGGMDEANARFLQNPFGGVALNVVARYDLSRRWMFTSGIGISTFGFDYGLSENYSLRFSPKPQNSVTQNEFALFEVPTMIHYKFTPNCRNSKLVIGAGFVHTLIGAQASSSTYVKNTEGNTNGDYLTSSASSTDALNCTMRFSFGREKLMKRGSILNASMVFNLGFKELARSTVDYRVDGKDYHHEFVNKGNFIGFRISYFFRPL